MAKLSQLLKETSERFQAAGIETPAADAELLIGHHLGVSRGELQAMSLLDSDVEVTPALSEMLLKREARVPLQHITGKAPFRNLLLEVGPGVFVPRPETESVVDIALKAISNKPKAKVLDIGTGSAAIAISIATESGASVTAVEKSETATAFARRNIDNFAPQVELLAGDFRELDLGFGVYDLVVSNPPYIPLSAIPKDVEVREHDPDLALYGGEDGLDLIRDIIENATYLLAPGGHLVLEHADGQSDAVCELLLGNWQKVTAHQDATGRYRAVSAVR